MTQVRLLSLRESDRGLSGMPYSSAILKRSSTYKE